MISWAWVISMKNWSRKMYCRRTFNGARSQFRELIECKAKSEREKNKQPNTMEMQAKIHRTVVHGPHNEFAIGERAIPSSSCSYYSVHPDVLCIMWTCNTCRRNFVVSNFESNWWFIVSICYCDKWNRLSMSKPDGLASVDSDVFAPRNVLHSSMNNWHVPSSSFECE